MNTSLNVSYNTNQNSHAASSYRLSLADTSDAVTGRLIQRGETFNNIVSYAGVFESRAKAVAAALAYIDGSVRVVELNSGGDIRVVLQPATEKLPPLDEFTTARVLGSRTERGTFIAS